MGLGGVALVPLAEARELAYRYRKIARSGGDPIAERRTETNIPPTFADAAMQVHEKNRPTWSNPKHAQQWINTLQTYAFPTIGDGRFAGSVPVLAGEAGNGATGASTYQHGHGLGQGSRLPVR
jgi:hypothetical protein